MCIIHDLSLHHIFQNMIVAFEQSKMISPLFLKRVGCLICTCKTEIYYDSKTIFSTQRSLYNWFDESLKDLTATKSLSHFKSIVGELKDNGRIDSGTKITFMSLLKDVSSLDFSKLRLLGDEMKNRKQVSKRNIFLTKLVKLKFDLSLCSAKEFTELLNKIDNCAIKYIQITNNSKITLRDVAHLSLRHFMGQVEATVEAKTEKSLKQGEKSLKLLADAVHYRLVKELHSCDIMNKFGLKATSFCDIKVLLQSPPQSLQKSFNETMSSVLQSHNTSLNETNSLKPERMYKFKERKNSFGKKSPSTTMNENDSFLNMSQNSIDNKTPLTSSPASSPTSSYAPVSFGFKKKSTHNMINASPNFCQNFTNKRSNFVKNDTFPKHNDFFSQNKFSYSKRYNDFGYPNKFSYNGSYSDKRQYKFTNELKY